MTQTKIGAAYVEAFAEIDAAIKASENAAFKSGGKASKYADISAVIAAIKPSLVKHELAFIQPCEPSVDGVTVRTILLHVSGETLDMGALFVPANKRDAQGFGSAMTYARRYALQSCFGVPTEDDDGNSASASMGQGQSQNGAVSPAPQAVTDAINIINAATTLAALQSTWTALNKDLQRVDDVIAAKDARKASLAQPVLDDEIPY